MKPGPTLSIKAEAVRVDAANAIETLRSIIGPVLISGMSFSDMVAQMNDHLRKGNGKLDNE